MYTSTTTTLPVGILKWRLINDDTKHSCNKIKYVFMEQVIVVSFHVDAFVFAFALPPSTD